MSPSRQQKRVSFDEMSNNNVPNNARTGVSRRSTDLSQEAVDKRTDDPQEMADPLLNSIIPCPLNQSEEVSMPYCIWIVILYGAAIYCCWPLLLLAFVLYRLITFDVNAGTLPNQSRGVCLISSGLCNYEWIRDAQEEGRMGQPTDIGIQLPPADPMIVPELLLTEDVQEHEPIAPPAFDLVPNVNHDIPMLREMIYDTIHHENTSGVAESQDDSFSSDSSEEDEIFSLDADDEHDSNDDIHEQDQNSPIPSVYVIPIPNHVTGSTVGTPGSNTSQNQAQDVDLNTQNPIDNTHQLVLPPPRLTCIIVPKPFDRLHLHNQSSDEYVD